MRHAIWLAAFWLAGSAGAQEAAIGYVKNVSGEASVTTAGKSAKAAVGTPTPGSKIT